MSEGKSKSLGVPRPFDSGGWGSVCKVGEPVLSPRPFINSFLQPNRYLPCLSVSMVTEFVLVSNKETVYFEFKHITDTRHLSSPPVFVEDRTTTR